MTPPGLHPRSLLPYLDIIHSSHWECAAYKLATLSAPGTYTGLTKPPPSIAAAASLNTQPANAAALPHAVTAEPITQSINMFVELTDSMTPQNTLTLRSNLSTATTTTTLPLAQPAVRE